MFRVTKKPNTPNMIWDAEWYCLLCKFENGILETDNADLAKKIGEHGAYSSRNF